VQQALLDSGADAGSTGIGLWVTAAGIAEFVAQGVSVSGGAVAAGDMLTGVLDGAGMSLYINGVEVASGGAGGAVTAGPYALRIGAGDAAHYTNGTIAHPAVFPVALSPARILAHYNAAKNTAGRIVQRWSRGGLVGTQTAVIERSTDSGATWQTAASGVALTLPSQSVIYDDVAAPQGTPLQYRAEIQATPASPPATVTSAYSQTVSTEITPDGWTLTDPADPTISLQLHRVSLMSTATTNMAVPTTVEYDTTEQMGVFYGFGNGVPIVQRGTIQSPTFTIAAYIYGYAAYKTWQSLTGRDGSVPPRQHTLLLRSDMGDSWYVVIGPTLPDQLLKSPDRITNPRWVVTAPCIVTSAP